MNQKKTPPTWPLGALAGLFVAGGLVAFFFLWRISTWQQIEPDGQIVYLVPGGDGRIDPQIFGLLGEIGGGAIGIGLVLAIATSRLAAKRRRAG